MKTRKAFTLVELLTVIAIIAILTALLFPVFAQAKQAAKKSADMTNMGTLSQALLAYRNDQGGFPPLLLQVVEYDPNLLRDRRVDELRRAYLYRSRVKDIKVFAAAIADATKDGQVTAFWPNRDPRPLGPGETCDERQIYGRELAGDPCPATAFGIGAAGDDPVLYFQLGIDPTAINGDSPTDPVRFYEFDSYDVAPVQDPGGGIRYELRYALFWSLAGQLGGGPNDTPRQLGYNDPPEDTVVTWNTYFRRYDDPAGPEVPFRKKSDLVLYLSGDVRVEDSRDMFERSWRFGR